MKIFARNWKYIIDGNGGWDGNRTWKTTVVGRCMLIYFTKPSN